ncbi:type IV pilus secretin PilQ [Desulfonatronospira sp.]|uniref:type IV pilus secretin PilQ n=1 Tax=Desulfonatronospira sp. TaxID=1962951 RepID=UPI0025BE1322|nr:type IV pilus secretin PilQ [Desulfonatronospira sp.]
MISPSRFWVALFTVLFLSGCASTRQEPEQDFRELWLERAEEYRGYSPNPREKEIKEPNIFKGIEDLKAADDLRRLPRENVNLKFRDIDIRVILRALAAAAEQNIVMSNNVEGSMSIDLRDIPWDQAFLSIVRTNGLSYSWEGDIIRVQSIQDKETEVALRSVKRNVEPVQTTVVDIEYAHIVNRGIDDDDDNLDQLEETLQALLENISSDGRQGNLFVDRENNALIIQATHEDTQRVLHVFRHLDQPRAQILLEAHIVEATQETARDLGLQWGGRYRSERIHGDERLYIAPGGQTVLDFPAEVEERGMTLEAMYGIMSGNMLEMQLTALQKEDKLNILSSPSLTTLNNQMAFTQHGEEVPYPVREFIGETISSITIDFKEAMLRLEMTPNILDQDQLRLHVNIKKEEVDFSRQVQGYPLIIKKHTQTNLVVSSGETVVISGLTKESSLGRESGVPGLMNVPLLGNLFKRDLRSKDMQEVLVFITPHILPQRPIHRR